MHNEINFFKAIIIIKKTLKNYTNKMKLKNVAIYTFSGNSYKDFCLPKIRAVK